MRFPSPGPQQSPGMLYSKQTAMVESSQFTGREAVTWQQWCSRVGVRDSVWYPGRNIWRAPGPGRSGSHGICWELAATTESLPSATLFWVPRGHRVASWLRLFRKVTYTYTNMVSGSRKECPEWVQFVQRNMEKEAGASNWDDQGKFRRRKWCRGLQQPVNVLGTGRREDLEATLWSH